MALNFRHEEILRLARESGRVTVDGLSNTLNVTAQTIRRDLGDLCDKGHLSRVHGGAILPLGIYNLGYEERRALSFPEKRGIAKHIAAQIPDGASLFLNIGTTTEEVARALIGHRNLLVLTNNLNVANILSANSHSEVLIAGGILRRADGGIVGDIAVDFVNQFHVDFAVISCAAISHSGVMLDYDYREVRVSKAILANARRSILVADFAKFGRHAPVRIESIATLDQFVTDRQPSDEIAALCQTNDVTLEIAEPIY